MKQLQIDVWSDIACPWCWVGKRRLEAALARFPHRDAVRIHWRAFELDPGAPRETDVSGGYAQRLARKYGRSVAQAQGMIDDMTRVAAADGLDFHFERIRPTNMFDAHRVLHLAAARGLGDAAKERLLRAYMSEGSLLADHDVLVQLASEVGLDADEVRALLESDRYAREVRADEAEANANDIHGVPFFVFGGRYAVSGAHPADSLLRVLHKTWDELPDQPETLVAEGAVCGPDGCA